MEAFILTCLGFFASISGSWAYSVILITLFSRILFLPLQYSSLRNNQKLKLINKDLDLLKEKSKDPKALAKKKLELFKRHQFNPIIGLFFPIAQGLFYYFLFQTLGGLSIGEGLLWIENLNYADELFVLPLLFSLTLFFSFRGKLEENMKGLKYIMPVLSFFFLYKMKSIVLVYFLSNSLCSILIEWGMERLAYTLHT